MSNIIYKSDASYVSCRAGVYYHIRRVPYDVRQHYGSKRHRCSLKTKSYARAMRAAQSMTQGLEDYWLGRRLEDMDIPAIHFRKLILSQLGTSAVSGRAVMKCQDKARQSPSPDGKRT